MRLNRRQFLLSTAAAPAVFAQSRPPPNVLFILADEWPKPSERPGIAPVGSESGTSTAARTGSTGGRLAYIPPEKRFGFDYWKACECTHDYNKSLYYEGNDPTPKYWPGYDAFAQTDDACLFIGAHAKSNDPFCLVLSLGPPHFPLQTAPQQFRAMFEGRAIALRENVPADRRSESAEMHRGYYAHMAALDVCFGRLLNALDRARIAEDTIVVFTSDHGDMMLSQGSRPSCIPGIAPTAAAGLPPESIRVPFLLRYPRKLGTRAAASAARSMRRTFADAARAGRDSHSGFGRSRGLFRPGYRRQRAG
jgi:arylsulfatase A-like enzyme